MDLIIHNARILTMDSALPRAQAVAVHSGRIAAVGTDSEMLRLRTDKTGVVNGLGRTVVPGFHDSHMHLLGYARTRGQADLRNLNSLEALVDRVRQFTLETRPRPVEWALGRGWDQTGWPEGRMPDRRDLDRVSMDIPVMLTRKCGHVCVLNTAALKACGILDNPPAVDGGLVETDEHGVATGILKENALALAKPPEPEMDAGRLQGMIALAAKDFVQAGLTTVQTDDLCVYHGEPSVLLDVYRGMACDGTLPLRVIQQMQMPEIGMLKDAIAEGYVTGWGSGRFRIGPLKLLTDGSLGGRSALLREHYYDDPSTSGISLFEQSQLNELVLTAHRAGMQVAAHAIGDGAIENVLDAFQFAQERHPRPDPRFRVVHASLTAPDLMERFRSLGVLADVQPAFVPADAPFLTARLGARRAKNAYRFRDFLDMGVHLGGGSDCPVEDFRPLTGIHAAVNRAENGAAPDQRLTVQEAVYLYTMGSAYTAFEENTKGSVTPGKAADLVVLSEDMECVNPARIRDVRADMTIVGGKAVYSR